MVKSFADLASSTLINGILSKIKTNGTVYVLMLQSGCSSITIFLVSVKMDLLSHLVILHHLVY